MSLRPINQQAKATPEKEVNAAPETKGRNDRGDYRHSSRRDDRDRDEGQEDREELRDGLMSIRQATANKFGERTNPTRALTALAKYAKGYIESKVRTKDLNYDVVIVEKDVAVPSVVIVSRTDDTDGEGKPVSLIVGHAIMLVDYSRKPDTLEVVRDGSLTYEDPTVWADAFDDDYVEAIEEQITAQLDGIEDLFFIKAGCTTYNFPDLPVDQLINDQGFQSASIDNLIFTVLTAVEALRAIEAEEQDTWLRPELLSKRSKIVADINLSVNTSTTPSGTPVAEDFMISVREVKDGDGRRDNRKNQPPRSLNRRNENSEERYGAISGRIDFTYVEPRANSVADPRIEDAACHVPEFIIAGFDVYDRAPSLPLLWQLISSTGMLYNRKPPIFLSAFRPENVMDAPSRNLGALAMEVKDIKTDKNLERINFRANTPDETLRAFARASIVDGARIGMEIPSQGPLTSLLNIFYDAAIYAMDEEEDYLPANAMLVEAADVLCGGLISEAWDADRPVMVAEIANVPGGYWTDDHGQKRDSREMGYLFYANLENPKEALEMSREYADSFYETDPIIAANIRRRLITEIKGTNFVQTDNYRRVYFDPDFIELLNTCLRKCGLGVMTPNTNFGGRGDERPRLESVRGFMAGDRLDHGYSRYSDRRDEGRSRYGRNERRTTSRRSYR